MRHLPRLCTVALVAAAVLVLHSPSSYAQGYVPPSGTGGGGDAYLGADQTWTGQQTFIDNKFLIRDNLVATKKMQFDMSLVGSGQTSTMFPPDASGTLPLLETTQSWTAQQNFTAGLKVNSGWPLFIGSTPDFGVLRYNVNQTPSQLLLGLPSSGNALLLADRATENYNFAHVASTNPVLYIQDATASTTNWMSVGVYAGFGIPVAQIDTGGSSALLLGSVTGGRGYQLIFNSLSNTVYTDAYSMRMKGAYADDGQGGAMLENSSGVSAGVPGFTPGAFFVGNGFQSNSPVNGLISGTSGYTGANTQGATLTIAGGRGNGTGKSGNVAVQTAPTGTTSGLTLGTWATRDVIVAAAKPLTEGSATGFWRVDVASGSAAGGRVGYCVKANDGTNQQARCGSIPWAVVNDAGTPSCTFGTATDVVPAGMAGTLTVAFTCPSNVANTVDLSAAATSSLTQTLLEIGFRVERDYGTGAMTQL